MKIAIHARENSFSEGWISYCERNKVPFKIVNAYDTDIISHVDDCEIFMWHHHHYDPRDMLFAKQLLFSLEQAGKIVYPDYLTTWHFDDKLGQKYLLEALKLPLIPTFAFYSKRDALEWAEGFTFPAVFKLRGGAGSHNVRLVSSKQEAISVINKCFGSGFRYFDPITHIKESGRRFNKGQASLLSLVRSFGRLIVPFPIEKATGRQKGYALFQEFIPDCNIDIRVQVVGNRAYAMTRQVRENDFRASGSGLIDFDGSQIPKMLIKQSFEITGALKMQSLAIDYVPFEDSYLIAELSYAWGIAEGELEGGFWDDGLQWHAGRIDPFAWIIENVIQTHKEKILQAPVVSIDRRDGPRQRI